MHFAPAFTAACAGRDIEEPKKTVVIRIANALFMQKEYLAILDLSALHSNKGSSSTRKFRFSAAKALQKVKIGIQNCIISANARFANLAKILSRLGLNPTYIDCRAITDKRFQL